MDDMDEILTVEIHDDKVSIRNEYSAGSVYEIPDDGHFLENVVWAFSDYVHSYYGDGEDYDDDDM